MRIRALRRTCVAMAHPFPPRSWGIRPTGWMGLRWAPTRSAGQESALSSPGPHSSRPTGSRPRRFCGRPLPQSGSRGWSGESTWRCRRAFPPWTRRRTPRPPSPRSAGESRARFGSRGSSGWPGSRTGRSTRTARTTRTATRLGPAGRPDTSRGRRPPGPSPRSRRARPCGPGTPARSWGRRRPRTGTPAHGRPGPVPPPGCPRSTRPRSSVGRAGRSARDPRRGRGPYDP